MPDPFKKILKGKKKSLKQHLILFITSHWVSLIIKILKILKMNIDFENYIKFSQKNNIWKLSRNVFDEYSAFTDKVSIYDINEIYRIGNEAYVLFYKSYLDLSKFDSNHIDIMVNNLGVMKQYENINIKKYEIMIFNKTDLLPKIYLYFITFKKTSKIPKPF